MKPRMKPQWKPWARQGIYAALLVAVVMGLSTLPWPGAPAVRAYAVFFLSESVELSRLASPLREWAARQGLDDWWPPWRPWMPEAPGPHPDHPGFSPDEEVRRPSGASLPSGGEGPRDTAGTTPPGSAVPPSPGLFSPHAPHGFV